jgi:hypothetical protein
VHFHEGGPFPKSSAVATATEHGVSIWPSVDLNTGHEMVLLPIFPDWHNSARIRITGLKVEKPSDRMR